MTVLCKVLRAAENPPLSCLMVPPSVEVEGSAVYLSERPPKGADHSEIDHPPECGQLSHTARPEGIVANADGEVQLGEDSGGEPEVQVRQLTRPCPASFKRATSASASTSATPKESSTSSPCCTPCRLPPAASISRRNSPSRP